MYYLTFNGYIYTSSDGEGFVRDDDWPSASPRKLMVRASDFMFEEDLAALGAALARAPDDAAEKQADIAKLTFCGIFPGSSSGTVLQNRRNSFGRFVDLLQQSMLPGHAAIRTFNVSYLGSIESYSREEDLERLFRDVLSNHPTIDRIQLGRSELPSRFASLLVSSLPSTRTTPLLDLTLNLPYGEDSSECVQGICDMLRRDVPLRALSLVTSLKMNNCRSIFRSLAKNTHLQGLAIDVETVGDDTLCLATDSVPALRTLHLLGRFTMGGVESVARQLTTNSALVELRLYVIGISESEALLRTMVRVLATYNFTIRRLRFDAFAYLYPNELATIAVCLRRNERIRQALEQRPAYRVATTTLLPLVLEMVSNLPTLLFRFLRKSDINELFEHLLQVEARKKGGGGGANKKIRTA